MPPQPELGYLTRREGMLGSASVKLAANWVVSGSARWDLVANQINQYVVGAGYVDDCFVLAANYVTSYCYSAGTTPPVLSHAFMLQLGLRTIANSLRRPAEPVAFSRTGVRRATAETGSRASPVQIESADIANMTMTTTFLHRLSSLILGCAATSS